MFLEIENFLFHRPSIAQNNNLSSIFMFPIGVFFRIDRTLSNLFDKFEQNQLVGKVHVFILEYVLDKTGILVKIMQVPLNILMTQRGIFVALGSK